VLLNWSVFEVPGGGFLKSLLASAGVKAAVGLAREGGGPVEGVEVTRWSNGASELLALFGSYDGPVKVSLPEARLVNDLRQRKYLGKTTTFTTTLRANRATFFALQAAPEAAPELRFATPGARAGEILAGTVKISNASGRHPVRIRVTTPSGRQAEWFDRTLLVDGQPSDWTLPFAHNDPPGEWTIRAVDLLTNQAWAVRVRVR
ncbi:MAG: hypothetical protein NTY38_13125, partial [Acidobacteria bacterium]|nr:hypothetical protein [Acidobacteriota bacterium]